MPYGEKFLHRVGPSGSTHVLLPDIYGNISDIVGITRVTDNSGKQPSRVGDLYRRGLLRKFYARVRMPDDKIALRGLYCAGDSADNVGACIGKTLPTSGDVPGGTIISTAFRTRRRLS